MLNRHRIIAVGATTAALALAAPASALSLDPLFASSTPTAGGANATFIQVDNAWQGSTVRWDESTSTYYPASSSSGVPIGTLAWGTGLWGIDDFRTVLNGGVTAVASWTGSVTSGINFGDGCYNGQWSGAWGVAGSPPIFGGGVGCGDGNADPAEANAEDNWISYFDGYIRIDEADDYNFSVLYDDGFFFNLVGADGTLSIGQDFLNPRDRLGYSEDISLSPGLYRFELGAYDRLEAGVVDLRWRRGEETDWTLVPPEFLVREVPEPGTLVLLGAGLAGLALMRRRRTAAPT